MGDIKAETHGAHILRDSNEERMVKDSIIHQMSFIPNTDIVDHTDHILGDLTTYKMFK